MMKYPANESSTLEFKEKIPQKDQIVKTIIGFCNRYGGSLIIGVNDVGTIVGINPDEADKMMEYLDKMIYESTAPPIIPLIYTRQIYNHTLLIIEVSGGMNKPYYRVSEGLNKGTYIRLGRSTLKAKADMIEELKWYSRGISYEAMPVYHATLKQINNKRVSEFLNARKQNKKRKIKTVTSDVLESYDLTTSEHAKTYPTVAGILSFCDNPQRYFSEAIILCNRFSGIKGRYSIASHDCLGTLFEQFEAAYDFVVKQLDYSFEIIGKKRIEKLEVPPDAIRESILNAIVHRNYHIKALIKITIYDNRIEIYSPGGFPGPLDVSNLRQGITFLRNPAICKLFREAGYIEKLGTGLIEIFDLYEQAGLDTPTIQEGDNYVKYILPRTKLEKTTKGKPKNDLDDIMALFLNVSELSISDVVKILNIPRATAGRRLATLVKSEHLTMSGQGKSVRYHLKKEK